MCELGQLRVRQQLGQMRIDVAKCRLQLASRVVLSAVARALALGDGLERPGDGEVDQRLGARGLARSGWSAAVKLFEQPAGQSVPERVGLEDHWGAEGPGLGVAAAGNELEQRDQLTGVALGLGLGDQVGRDQGRAAGRKGRDSLRQRERRLSPLVEREPPERAACRRRRESLAEGRDLEPLKPDGECFEPRSGARQGVPPEQHCIQIGGPVGEKPGSASAR